MSEETAEYKVSMICGSPDNRKVKVTKMYPYAIFPRRCGWSTAYALCINGEAIVDRPRQEIALGFSLALPDGIEARIEPGASIYGVRGFRLIEAIPEAGKIYGGMWQRIDKDERFNADVLPARIGPEHNGKELRLVIRNNDPDTPFLIPSREVIATLTFNPYVCPDIELNGWA